MQQECIAEPISWLRLEQYALGELPEGADRNISRHLQICPSCRARHEQIGCDGSPLLPLPAAPPRRFWNIPGWVLPTGGAWIFATIAVVLAAQRPTPRVKGEATVSFELVRQRGAALSDTPTAYRPGDRFKVMLHCANDAGIYWQVLVQQGDATATPLSAGHLPCGNNAAIPGAFALDGTEPVRVCVVTSMEHPVSQTPQVYHDSGTTTQCLMLAPEDDIKNSSVLP